MSTQQIIAQAFSILGMIFIVSSFQFKSEKKVIFCQLFGGLLFGINFLLLNATMGALTNFVGAIRSFLFLNNKRFHTDKKGWLYTFIFTFIILYILSFLVFGKEPTFKNLVIEFLPVIGMSALTIGFFKTDSKIIRKLGLIASPSWLIYDIISMTIGGIICETLSLISIIVGIIRYDIKQK